MTTLQTLSSAVKQATDAAQTATVQANIATQAQKAVTKAQQTVSTNLGESNAAKQQVSTDAAAAVAAAAAATGQASAAAGSATTASTAAANATSIIASVPNLGRRAATWLTVGSVPGLSTITAGLVTGSLGEVTNDTGTHTDPVTAATVPNAGLYMFVSPTGWTWVGSRVNDALIQQAAALGDRVQPTSAAPPSDNRTLIQAADGETMLAYDAAREALFGAAIDNMGLSRVEMWRAYANAIAGVPRVYINGEGWNHYVVWGQSNALGSADALPALSTVQPYFNVTFNGGTRANGVEWAWTGTKPLVEEQQIGNSESPCAGATEFLNNYAARHHGITPAQLIQFASVAATGATIISGLDKPSPAYSRLLDHATNAKAFATGLGKLYNIPVVYGIEGESDAGAGTTRATYVALQDQFVTDLNTDLKAIKGNTDDVYLFLAQPSYKATNPSATNIALAHLDGEANKLIHVTHPTYCLPWQEDDTHRSRIGHKLEGAYFGRGTGQLLLQRRKPDTLRFVSAIARGANLWARAYVPTYPLRIDYSGAVVAHLQKAQDAGMQVIDDSGVVAILAMFIENGDTVRLSLSRALAANPRFRVGLDYLPWNLGVFTAGITDGATTNLRDSTADTFDITQDGVTQTFTLAHWALHQELSVTKLAS